MINIKNILTENNCPTITCNAMVGQFIISSFPEDSIKYKNSILLDKTGTLFEIGEIFNKKLIIDVTILFDQFKVFDNKNNVVLDLEKFKDLILN